LRQIADISVASCGGSAGGLLVNLARTSSASGRSLLHSPREGLSGKGGIHGYQPSNACRVGQASGLNRAFDLARLTGRYREMKSAVVGTAPPSVMADPNKQPIVARHFPQTTPTALDAGHRPQFGLPDEVARSWWSCACPSEATTPVRFKALALRKLEPSAHTVEYRLDRMRPAKRRSVMTHIHDEYGQLRTDSW